MKKEKIFKKLAAFALSGIMLFSSVSVIACNDGDDDSSEVVKSDTETQKSEDDSGKKDQSEKKDEQNQSGEVSNALELTKAFIIGDITSGNWVELKLADDKKSASYTFTYDGSAMTKWGGGNGTGSFKFSEFGDWNNPSYGGEGAEIFVSPDTALLEVTSGTSRKNIKCTEFITENEYTITLWKTGEGSCKIKLVTSKMVHEPEVIVEKPNEFKFNTFAASDSSVISFSDKKLTLVDNSGNAVSYEYEIGDAGSKASVKNGDSKVSIELSDGKFKFGGKDYSLSEDKLVAGGKVYSITASDRAKCYIEDRENETIIFIFDYANWGQTQEVKTAYVRGSFTSWKDKDAFAMSYAKNLSLNYVSVSKREVVTIGNSGHPEYKFYINNSYMGTEGVSFVPEGYIFHTSDENLIVVYSDENLEEIIAESNIAGKVKALADFDITTRAGKEEVSNFRLVQTRNSANGFRLLLIS